MMSRPIGKASPRSSMICYKFISITVLLLSVSIGVLIKSLPAAHHSNRPIPVEAVPQWQTSEVHWAVRYFIGYLFGALFPVGQLLKCPTTVDWQNLTEAKEAEACMNPMRASMESADGMVDLNALFDVQAIDIPRDDGNNNPIHVTLLKKKKSSYTVTKTNNSKSAAPLILYMHGGGFIMRAGKNGFASEVFSYLLQLGEEDENADDSASSFIDDAVWAVVDYRLAPEYLYPAAPDDCLFTLNYLVNVMNLGRGGIHISGISAGATLAMEVTLKSLDMNIDTFYLDEPMVPLPSKDSNPKSWTLDSNSFRRHSYSRVSPVELAEWTLKAVTGMDTNHELESSIAYGMIETDVDITGGATDAANWKSAFDESNATQLPRLFLLTTHGDPFMDGGLYFKSVYEDVLKLVDAEVLKDTDRQPQIKHVESFTGHTLHLMLERSLFREMTKEWYAEMKRAYYRKL